MTDEMVKLFYGSLLHDIGKAIQRSDSSKTFIKHSKIGGDFLREYTDDKDILNSLRYHHTAEINSTRLADDSLSYITYIADNIASGTDRRREDPADNKNRFDSETPLTDIFNRYGKTKSERYIHPGELSLDNLDELVPTTKRFDYTKGEYARGVAYFAQGLKALDFTADYIPSILNLLEATMGFMPSSTNTHEEADVSLFDHMKLTAAFAVAIKQYLDYQKITDYRSELYRDSNKFYQKQAFIMVGYDFDGVQKFISTITSKGAHKQLRSRAFYLEMMSQWFVDALLRELGLTEANVLYADTNHGYLIMGNTPNNRRIVEDLQAEFQAFLLENFGTDLYLSVGMAAFRANQVRTKNTSAEYIKIFREIDSTIKKNKLARYDAAKIMQLNEEQNHSGRECAVCHRVSNLLENENKCLLCSKLENFSASIQNEDFFVVDTDENGLPLGLGGFLKVVSRDEIVAGDVNGHIYSKNQLNTGLKQDSYLWVSDYSATENNDYNYYAKRTWMQDEDGYVVGIKKLGALMIDVDDLYAGFLAGFHKQGEGQFTTIGRYATLSRRLSLFFKIYLNDYAQNYELSIIYSHGDDIFVLGAWDDLLYFVTDLYEGFKQWTDGKLTFSAAVTMFNAKTPINIIARQTGELLSEVKNSGQSKIGIFSNDYIYSFEEYIYDVTQGKLSHIQRFFEGESERGKTFIYNLLSLIRQRKEKISLARMAYFLTRLEENSSNKEAFRQFKLAIMNWLDSDEEINKLELALMLYVYETRKEY